MFMKSLTYYQRYLDFFNWFLKLATSASIERWFYSCWIETNQFTIPVLSIDPALPIWNGGTRRNQARFLFNTYFTSVVPTALSLQCNWLITGIQWNMDRISQRGLFKEVNSKLQLYQASLCTLTATHLTLIYVCTYILLSVPLGCLIKQTGIIIHTILNLWETLEIEPVTSGLTSVYRTSMRQAPDPFRHIDV